ncbi:MAG: divergent polysaccharide deacetylase family protein [Thermodesulfobacteriota bacterium]|nr:divergent polysaccharide deacetylase family protein [Thermodesulfobacteriota bacterium]
MATDKKTGPTEGGLRDQKGTNHRGITYLVIPMAALLILVGIWTYRKDRPAPSRPVRHFPIPVFEIHESHGTEAKVKELDRHLCDALLALGVPQEALLFNSVETRRDGQDWWTYSDMEVQMEKAPPMTEVQAVFLRTLGLSLPEGGLLFQAGPQDQTVVEVSVNGHGTHRVAFVALTDKETFPSLPVGLPQIAIIIDDFGYDKETALKFLELDGVFTFSVLPHSPFQSEIASAIHETGRDVLLHLPMEPLDYPVVNPGKGALTSAMGSKELLDQLRDDLAAVPFIVGVNNHMGSKLTQDVEKMRQIFQVLKNEDLFFIDSLTSPLSTCKDAAKGLDLKFACRQVFLDHVQEPDAIRFQIKRLVTMAKTRGRAIGIGHPYAITWKILKEQLPAIREQVDLVPVSKIVG